MPLRKAKSRSTSARPTSVVVTAHPSDALVATDIEVGLKKLGITARLGDPEPTDTALVVVLSPALSQERLLEMALIEDARLVPVVARPVDASTVPSVLASLNWIPWLPDQRGQTVRMIASACLTDLPQYRATQSLLARAEGWVAAGRLPQDTIKTPRALKQARKDAADSGLERTPPVVVEFLARSEAATRATLIRRWLRGLAWFVISALLVAASIRVWGSLEYIRERHRLDLLASSLMETPFPNVQMMKLAALMTINLDHGERPSAEVSDMVLGLMVEPSPTQRFVLSPDAMFINGTAIDDEGNMLWGDGAGGIWKMAKGASTPVRIAEGVTPMLDYFAAVPDGSVWAAAGYEEVVVQRDGVRQALAVAGISGLILSPDGSVLGIDTEHGFEVWDLAATPQRILRTFPEQVLGYGVLADQLTTVIRGDGTIRVVAAASGEVIRELPDIANDMSTAAVGRAGQVVVQGLDHRLWLSDGDRFESTGIPVDDLLSGLAITEQGVLLHANNGGVVQLTDLSSLRPRGTVCTSASVVGLTTSPDGTWVICDYGADNEAWDLGRVLPRPPDATAQATLTAAAGGVAASVAGRDITITKSGQASHTLSIPELVSSGWSRGGTASTVALSTDGLGLAVGSDFGDVVLLDVTIAGELRGAMAWSSPDGSPVLGIELEAQQAAVHTTTGTWAIPACVGCSGDPDLLLDVVRTHLMPCYGSGTEDLVGPRAVERLGIVTCPGA